MNTDPSFNWSLANPNGIQVDDAGNVWHAGCVRDLLITRSGATLAASDTGGVWSLSSVAVSLADLDPPDLSCLAQGPRADNHAYAGGSALYETDVTQGAPLLAWQRVPIVDSSNNSLGVGWVYRIGVTRERRRLVLATNIGLLWADMTYPTEEPPGCLCAVFGGKPTPKPPAPYAFTLVPFLPRGPYFGLAIGPGDLIAAAPWGDGSTAGLSGLISGDLGTGAFQRASILGSGFRESDMRATTIAACEGTPQVMYAVSSDSDGFFLGLLRSEDGGVTWHKLPLNVTNLPMGKAARDILGNGGNTVRPCNAVAVATNNPDVAAIVWRHEGVLITTDGGKHWEMREGAPHVHADLHAVLFDPRDASDRTLLVGEDGGVVMTTDQCRSFDSSMNRQFPNFQFQSCPRRMFYGSFSGSRFVPGLIAGGLQDNGNVVSVVQQGMVTPWLRFARADDGQVTTFIENQRTLYYFNDDPNMQSVAWDPSPKAKEHAYDLLRGVDPSGPELIQDLVVSPLRAAGDEKQSGLRMYAVGVRNARPDGNLVVDSTALYAYYSKNDGSDGHWERLAEFGVDFSDLSAAGSFNGTAIFFGTVDGQLYVYEPSFQRATKLGVVLKTAGISGSIDRILAVSDEEVYAVYNAGNGGFILQFLGHHFEEMGNGLPSNDWFYGLETYMDAEDRLVLIAASDSKVYVTRDRGASWLDGSSGLPRRPHGCDLSYVHQSDGNAFVYLATYGRSAWVTQVTFSIDVRPR